jgi:hypothetical protein
MKKTILIVGSLAVLTMIVMGFEGAEKKRLIQVERVGVGNWRTTIFINASQVVGFEQATPNMDGASTKVYFGSPSHGSEDKTVVMSISNDFYDFKQQMEEALQ